MSKLRSVKGMNDLLPSEIGRWHRLERAFREAVERYGFAEVRTPIVEPTALFVRSIGGALFPDDGHALTGLLEVADSALYAAKRAGRDAVRIGRHTFPAEPEHA